MEHKWPALIRNLLDVGLTQTQVAAAIGVTQSAVSQVLNAGGKRGFGFASGNALIRLHALHCSSDAPNPHRSFIWPDVASPPQPGEDPGQNEAAHV